MNHSLKDKVILVTGGTSGIGEGCARHFASLGARVVIASNQQERGDALEAELRAAGHDALFIFTDVSREESVQAFVARAVEHYGRIDGLHCNAGVWAKGKVTDFDDAVWERVMGVNVKSVFWTAKHVVPVMEAAGKRRACSSPHPSPRTSASPRTRFIAHRRPLSNPDRALPRGRSRGQGARRRHFARHD